MISTYPTPTPGATFLSTYEIPRTETGEIDLKQAGEDTKHLPFIEAIDALMSLTQRKTQEAIQRADERAKPLRFEELGRKYPDASPESFSLRMRQAILKLEKDPYEAIRQFDACLEVAELLELRCQPMRWAVTRAKTKLPPTWRDYHNGLYTGWENKVRNALAEALRIFEFEDGQTPFEGAEVWGDEVAC